jgi:hypothetical protein
MGDLRQQPIDQAEVTAGDPQDGRQDIFIVDSALGQRNAGRPPLPQGAAGSAWASGWNWWTKPTREYSCG